MERIWAGTNEGKVISLLEGGYDTDDDTLGLAKCVVSHVKSLQERSSVN
jgi:acetoin utilization deacetylase AcuC-like enzyme